MSEQEYKHIIHHLVEFSGFKLETAIRWMHSRLPELKDNKPVDLVKAGRADDVWKIISLMDDILPP